jgi:hypothetical protein
MSQNNSRKSILRKMYLNFKKGKNIQDPSYILHVMCCLRLILQYFIAIFLLCKGCFCIFWPLFGNFLECKCWLQYVNYYFCSPYNILLLNTFLKFSWKLTWIWRRAALKELKRFWSTNYPISVQTIWQYNFYE